MNGQNVVIRAEKGKVRMMVDESLDSKELVYDMKKEDSDHVNQEKNQNQEDIHSGRKTQSGPVCLDGTEDRHGDMPGDESALGVVGPLAESGDGGNVVCPGTEKEGTIPDYKRSIEETPGEETFFQERRDSETRGKAGDGAAEAQ